MKSFGFNNVNDALPVLLESLLKHGDEVGSRLGERTLELTHVALTLRKPWQRELLLPSRKANVAAQIAETMWVLSGRNDIGWLQHYLPRAVDFSDDGETWRAGYGPRLRNYGDSPGVGVDQLAYIVDTLRSSPGSRQAVATIWDPFPDTTPGKDRACNNWLHFLARKGKLDLMVGIRSNDAMWGWSGINAFEWSALLEIVAGMIGHEVGELHFAVGSFHLYDRHWDKARTLAQQTDGWAWADDSPRFDATGLDDMASFDYLCAWWFRLEADIRAGNSHVWQEVNDFPEPMMRSWLRVLQWYWTGDFAFLQPIAHTRLAVACGVGVAPKGRPQAKCACGELSVAADGSHRTELAGISHGLTPCHKVEQEDPPFIVYVNDLHAQKHAAYGDSWKRRGEYMILANIARKIDRLEGGADTPDETQTDTAIDLLVYLAKYRCWLDDPSRGGPDDVELVLERLDAQHEMTGHATTERELIEGFSVLEQADTRVRKAIVDNLLHPAYCLAWSRYAA